MEMCPMCNHEHTAREKCSAPECDCVGEMMCAACNHEHAKGESCKECGCAE